MSASTGSDGHDGLSPERPKRTLAAGKALLRHGMPDWLLLKRGDVWQEGLGHWKLSGRSPREPMVVAAYGPATARPLLQTGSEDGLTIVGGGGTPARIEHLAFVGLHFQPHRYEGTVSCVGARVLRPSRHLLFEDCHFQDYTTNLVLDAYDGRHEELRVRRCVVVDAWALHGVAGVGHPQGLYAYAVDGLLIEENLFDHNGWRAGVPDAGPDVFRHNLYINNGNTGVTVRGNIIANASSHGMQLRCGGTATDNLFVRNAIALSVGGGNAPEPGGVTGLVAGNVILDGKDIDPEHPRGWGLWFGNIAQGEVSGNLVAHNSLGMMPRALLIAGDARGDTGPTVGVHDLRIRGNVFYDWGGSLVVEGDASQLTGIVLEDNDFQEPRRDLLAEFGDPDGAAALLWSGNRLGGPSAPSDASVQLGGRRVPLAQWLTSLGPHALDPRPAHHPDPQRGVPSYCHSVGLDASLAAFLEQARSQSRGRWRPEIMASALNRHMRDGFGLGCD
ncbi:MAG TPA: right-handed parallel beta-helix repeat-containing protein [Planctomycetota bacterium]|nr:right-handed parallel beta-helix repeat-containing protein [Planctomycetota bacterium]